MSIGVLEGGEEPPRGLGPENGMYEFVVAEYPQTDINRPPLTREGYRHTKPYGEVIINLSMGSYHN